LRCQVGGGRENAKFPGVQRGRSTNKTEERREYDGQWAWTNDQTKIKRRKRLRKGPGGKKRFTRVGRGLLGEKKIKRLFLAGMKVNKKLLDSATVKRHVITKILHRKRSAKGSKRIDQMGEKIKKTLRGE